MLSAHTHRLYYSIYIKCPERTTVERHRAGQGLLGAGGGESASFWWNCSHRDCGQAHATLNTQASAQDPWNAWTAHSVRHLSAAPPSHTNCWCPGALRGRPSQGTAHAERTNCALSATSQLLPPIKWTSDASLPPCQCEHLINHLSSEAGSQPYPRVCKVSFKGLQGEAKLIFLDSLVF